MSHPAFGVNLQEKLLRKKWTESAAALEIPGEYAIAAYSMGLLAS